MKYHCVGRVAEFSDEDEEFSSNEEGEGSDSEPMLEERRARKAKMPVNARVTYYLRFQLEENLFIGLVSDGR